MKLRTIIIDDEPASAAALAWELEPLGGQIELVATFNAPQEALEKLPALRPDLVFLDIQMPALNGFELLRRLPTDLEFEVVFTTAFDQYALDAFKTAAADYLLKPVDETELRRAVERVQERLARPASQQQMERLFELLKKQNPAFPVLALPTLEGLEFLEVEEIMHCESSSNYTYIYTAQGERLLISKTLKEIEAVLSEHLHFFRVHHSHLVNMKFARRFIKGKNGELVLKNGKIVPVARSRKEELFGLF